MKPDFWIERWQRNEIGFHQGEINAHLQEFWPGLGVAAAAAVFVPLCGKTRDMLWLRGQGHPVLGIEISPLAVESFFRENDLEPEVSDAGRFQRWRCDDLTVLCGDFFDLRPADLEGTAAVYDRASLVALPEDMRPRYAARLGELLPAGARALLVTMEYPQAEMAGPPFSVGEEEVRALYDVAFEVERLFSRDILAENPRFRERGLSRMQEKVYRLSRRR